MDKTNNSHHHLGATETAREDAATIEALRRGAVQMQQGEGIDLDTAERQLRLKHGFRPYLVPSTGDLDRPASP
jgi:hypothetical protein